MTAALVVKISVRLTKDEHRLFQVWCRRNGVEGATAIRRIVQSVLVHGRLDEPAPLVVSPSAAARGERLHDGMRTVTP